MKISATYEDFPSIIEKIMIEIGTSVYQTIKPITKEVTVDGKTTTEHLVKFTICDERMGYVYEYEFDKYELKQFISSLQRMQLQLTESENSSNNNSSGMTCNRIQIK